MKRHSPNRPLTLEGQSPACVGRWCVRDRPVPPSSHLYSELLYLDDDTIRYWYKLYHQKGLSWLADFGYKGCPYGLHTP